MEKQRDDEKFEISIDGASAESEAYMMSMNGTTIELTWNHGTEDGSIEFNAWNGNTGGDASGALHAETPAYRGFGHVAFNVDDVYALSAQLEEDGVKFQKRPDEGNMKGLAFCLDPDGYWIELVARVKMQHPADMNLSQTMLRVKDGPASVKFYVEQLGMKLIKVLHFPQWKFSLFFLASVTDEDLAAQFEIHKQLFPDLQQGDTFDPEQENRMSSLMWEPCLELTWNHGCESDDTFKVHDGNADPQASPLIFEHSDICCDRGLDTLGS